MSNLNIRRARIDDVSPCLTIYNYEVVNGVATLDLETRTLSEWQEWFDAHKTSEHCIFVGLMDDVVVGYASLSPYRTKDAFKSTVELSIYIHQEYRGKGIASKLMAHILDHAKEMETLHTLVSIITAGNVASTAIHERFGFTYCGLTPQVGFKHGKYQDTETYALLV